MFVSYALALALQTASAATPRQSGIAPQPAAPAGPTLDAPAVAAALAGTTGAVVALVDGDSVVGGDLAKNLKLGNVRTLAGTPFVAYSDHLPYGSIFAVGKYRTAPARAQVGTTAFPPEAISGGTVTLKSAPGQGFRAQSLTQAKWALPLTISPAFGEQGIGAQVLAANVDKLPELDFLRAVARAVGGRFRQTGKEYRIEPNGAELRARALRSIDIARANAILSADGSMNPSDVSDGSGPRPRARAVRSTPGTAATATSVKARLDLAHDAIALVPPEAMEAFVEGRQGSLVVNLYGAQGLQQDILKLLQADAGSQGEADQVRRTLASIPITNPGTVEIGLGFTVTAVLNIETGRNRFRTMTVKAL